MIQALEPGYTATLEAWAERNPVNTIPALFRRTLAPAGAADRPFLGSKHNGVYRYENYGSVRDKVMAFAAALVEVGFEPGDRLAQLSNNRPEWVVADLGTMFAAGVHVPLFPTLAPEAVQYSLSDCEARVAVAATPKHLEAILAAAEEAPKLQHVVALFDAPAREERPKVWSWEAFLTSGREALDKQKPEIERRLAALKATDVCSMVYTSGTTGNPKGAMLMHGNFVSNALHCVPVLEYRADDLELSFLPLSHVFERVAYYCTLSVGACIAYAENIDKVSANMKEVRPTVMPSVPRLFEKIYARVMDGVSKKSPVQRAVFDWALKVGQKYHEARKTDSVGRVLKLQYAAAHTLALGRLHTETGGRVRLFVSGGAPLRKEIAQFFLSAGFTLVEGYGLTETSPVITVNPLRTPKTGTVGVLLPGNELKFGQDGEILCKGPNVMLGYFNKEEATREALDTDGWFHTGDIGELDSDGYLRITDRKKDLLVMSNGKKVAPQPIEQLLQKSPYIEQAVVLGDNRKYIAALLVPSYGNLKDWCNQNGAAVQPEQLAENAALRKFLQGEVDRLCADLSGYEKVKNVQLLPNEMTQENGELTPTLKVKRKVVNEKYSKQIEALYSESKGEG